MARANRHRMPGHVWRGEVLGTLAMLPTVGEPRKRGEPRRTGVTI